jgi:hypothetical protein
MNRSASAPSSATMDDVYGHQPADEMDIAAEAIALGDGAQGQQRVHIPLCRPTTATTTILEKKSLGGRDGRSIP